MPTDWRSLFNEVRITWVDRGPNSILGNPTIKCPLCGARDPSQHMVFSDVGYYCHRDRSHGGRSFPYILRQLLPSYTREQIVALLNRHWSDVPLSRSRPTPRLPSEVERMWSKFKPAHEHDAYLEYLHTRGFDDPESLSRRYDLRYAPTGRWAARLLIPLTDESGNITTWTGRAIRDMTLRYDTLAVARTDIVYVPRAMRANAVLVEGPIDALKVAEASEYLPISPIAILGTGVNEDRIARIISIVRSCLQVMVSLDSEERYDPIAKAHNSRYYGVSPTSSNVYKALIFSLAQSVRTAYIRRLPLPRGVKDFGEMPHREIISHLANFTDTSDKGNAYEHHHLTSVEYLASRR